LERITLKERIGDQFLEQAGGGAGAAEVKSPMPGTIFKILKAEGDTVTQGETVIIVEAMKMENEIKAPHNGRLDKVFVSLGKPVANKQKLFKISRLDAD
jgi:biotin carboxyl carrier protein